MLSKADAGDLPEALREVDNLFGKLLAKFQGWEKDAEFLRYMWRSVDLTAYRDSEHFKHRFGGTRPR